MAYRVYFGRLPESLSQDDFEKMLADHGKAKNIEWKSGFAYVDYKHGSDASKTVQNLNGKEVDGNNILVELAQNGGGGYAMAFATRPFTKAPQPRPIRTPHRVRIENLSSRAKWMELKELLSLAGEVTFADTHKRKTGEGVVEFATRKDLEEAIKAFHNTTFFGKTIKLYDESPRGRSRSPIKDRSRSRSRHRSSERKRRTRSKSLSPRRKSSTHRSGSPRRRSRRSRSLSKERNRSRRRRSRSRSPIKASRSSHKKSRKSKRDSSPPRPKSPHRKKHNKHNRSSSRSSSDNNNESKRNSKKKKQHLSGSSSGHGSDSGT